jgi:hypothetical protein
MNEPLLRPEIKYQANEEPLPKQPTEMVPQANSAPACCPPAEQVSCCEPSAKASCCAPSPSQSCGCR